MAEHAAPDSMEARASCPQPNLRLQTLREKIRVIERRPATLAITGDKSSPDVARISPPHATQAWTLGVPYLDDRNGQRGLETGAVHEIKPTASANWAASCASAHHFAVSLAVRRLAAVDPPPRQTTSILVCSSRSQAGELGAIYGPGAAALGLDPRRLIIVEAAKPPEVLWAIEEGLKSEGLALVLGHIDDIGLTPSRRLALAAARSKTPCLLLTHSRSAPAAATATRWRISPAPSAPHPLDVRAPGLARFLVGLQHCRGSPTAVPSAPLLLEWCDAAYCFRLASRLVDGAARTRQTTDRPHLARLAHAEPRLAMGRT